MRKQSRSYGSSIRRPRAAAQRHFHPRVEPLEDRRLLAQFTENFSNDYDPSQPGFDTWDDDPSTVSPDGMAIPYQISSSVNIFSTNLFPPAPSAPHFLALTRPNASYIIDFRTTQGQPGGLDPEGEVVAVTIGYSGLGRLEFFGENGTKRVTDFGGFDSWRNITVTGNSLSDSGTEMGAIQWVLLAADEGLYVDDVTVLVLDAGFSNNPPVANDDLLTTLPGQPVDFDPLANDGDFDGDPVRLLRFEPPPPTSGTILFHDGLFTYTPAPGFHGIASFDYFITDDRIPAGSEVLGTVRITVNTPPVANRDEYDLPHGFSGPFDVGFFGGRGILDNDFDADSDALTITVHGQPRHGEVTLMPDGSFQYTPMTAGGLVLPDAFAYSISDGYVTAHSEVLIRVPNAVPVASDDFLVVEHGILEIASLDVVSNDPGDPDGDPLSLPLVVTQPEHGTLHVLSDGRLRYVARGEHAVTDWFTYRLADPYAAVYGQSNLATVRILVPNRLPTAVNDEYRVAPATTLEVTADDGVLRNDRDPDDDFLFDVALTKQPGYGTLTLRGDGSFTYVPDGGFQGTDTFGYIASDGIGESHSTTVRLVVTTGAPLARPDTYVIAPDSTAVTLPLLDNDWDPDGRPLIFAIPTFPSHGSLFGGPDGSILYEPHAGYEGSDSFEYFVSNGIAGSRLTTVFLQITDDPNVPDTNFDHYSLLHDTTRTVPSTIGLLANDSLLPGPTTFVSLVRPPRFGTLNGLDLNDAGAFTYTPNPGFVGFDNFQYRITNNIYESEAQTVSIQVHDEAPLARDDSRTVRAGSLLIVNVLGNDADPDGEQLRVELVVEPSHGRAVLQPNGELYYQPDPGFGGLEVLTYRLFDGALYSEEAQVGIGTIDGGVAHVMTPSRHHVVLESTPGTRLENVRVLAAPPAAPPTDLQFPLGFFQFEIHGVPLGGFAGVTLDVLDTAAFINEYWKYGPTPDNATPHWHAFTYSVLTGIGARFPNLIFPISGDVHLGFIDGDRGDASGVDGVIVDPGGPVFVARAPRVAAVTINDGHAQRSKINSLTVTFDGLVTIDPGAFELRRMGMNRPIDLTVALSEMDGRTVALLTFHGAGVQHGSLKDGDYTLTIRATKIRDAAGRLLDGDGDAAAGGDYVDEFFRRFGDTDGDNDVDLVDAEMFATTFGKRSHQSGYLWYLDYNANGRIWAEDLALFLLGYCRSNQRT